MIAGLDRRDRSPSTITYSPVSSDIRWILTANPPSHRSMGLAKALLMLSTRIFHPPAVTTVASRPDAREMTLHHSSIPSERPGGARICSLAARGTTAAHSFILGGRSRSKVVGTRRMPRTAAGTFMPTLTTLGRGIAPLLASRTPGAFCSFSRCLIAPVVRLPCHGIFYFISHHDFMAKCCPSHASIGGRQWGCCRA